MDFSDVMKMLRDPSAMQAQAEQLRARTEAVEVTGSSGGGMVKIVMGGNFEMRSCVIAPEIVDPKDLGLIQDLVRAAHNDAVAKVKEAVQQELQSGMGLPPGLMGGFPGGLA